MPQVFTENSIGGNSQAVKEHPISRDEWCGCYIIQHSQNTQIFVSSMVTCYERNCFEDFTCMISVEYTINVEFPSTCVQY